MVCWAKIEKWLFQRARQRSPIRRKLHLRGKPTALHSTRAKVQIASGKWLDLILLCTLSNTELTDFGAAIVRAQQHKHQLIYEYLKQCDFEKFRMIFCVGAAENVDGAALPQHVSFRNANLSGATGGCGRGRAPVFRPHNCAECLELALALAA